MRRFAVHAFRQQSLRRAPAGSGEGGELETMGIQPPAVGNRIGEPRADKPAQGAIDRAESGSMARSTPRRA